MMVLCDVKEDSGRGPKSPRYGAQISLCLHDYITICVAHRGGRLRWQTHLLYLDITHL